MFFKSVGEENYSDVVIPSLFFDLYIPIANGNQIKVYLLGYKSAFLYRGFQSDGLDNKALANIIGISEEEVIEAWKYWEKMGIVKLHPMEDRFAIEFFDIKTEYLNKNSKSKYGTSSENIDDTVDDASSFEYINMYNRIEKIAGRVLTPSEKIDILDAVKFYEMDPEVAIKAFERAIEDNGRIKSVKYVLGIMKSWFDNAVKTLDDIDKVDDQRADKNENYKTVFKALGFNRTATSYEKDAIDRWVYDYNMTMDVILKACEKSVNTSNPNIRYFDAIIKSWYEKGITTVEEVEKEDLKFAKNKANNKKSYSKANNNTKNFKTKFHNFEESNSEKYSPEALDQLLKNANKRR